VPCDQSRAAATFMICCSMAKENGVPADEKVT
jgi:hypothetical protein